MTDFRLLNGGRKGTVIIRFDRSAVLLVNGKKKKFSNIDELKKYVSRKKIEINVEHIHPATAK